MTTEIRISRPLFRLHQWPIRTLVHDVPGPPNRMFSYATWLMLVHGLACWLVGRRLPLLQARFPYPAPAHADAYEHMFPGPRTYAAPRAEIRFDAAYLAQPLRRDELALESDRDVIVPGLGRHIQRRMSLIVRGVVDQPVDWTERHADARDRGGAAGDLLPHGLAGAPPRVDRGEVAAAE